GDMSAENLMQQMRRRYSIPDTWTEEQARMVIGMRYELYLRYLVQIDAYKAATDLTAEQMAAVVALDVPGLTVETSTVREYATKYAAHILGRVGLMDAKEYETYRAAGYSMDAVVGKEGLEQAFETALHGTDGQRVTTVASTGEIVDEHYSKLPVAGNNVYLTVDLDLQSVSEDALERTILDLRQNGAGSSKEGKDAEGGAMVVMDVNSGAVLASASYPTYDPATFNQNFNQLLQTSDSPLFNRVLQAAYYPGSIYKMVTSIAAIDAGGIGRYFQVYDKGKYAYYEGYQPNCFYYTKTGRTHGLIDMMQALAESCNYYFFEVGRMVGINAIDAVARQFGLGEETGVELPETAGQRANPETKAALYPDDPTQSDWYGADTLQASIGQSENKFTPMQMAVYTSTLANGGTRYQATFLSKIASADFKRTIEENTAKVLGKAVMSDEAIACYREGMRMAVTEGTAATYLKDYPVAVSAKTGTAQHGGEGSDNASLVVYAPAEQPEIAIVVYVEKGAQGGNLGQAARAVLDAYFAQKNSSAVEIFENQLG
ncbi:MAG: penicillin-binding transpeptidase domain-containing protein, partial [Oscillospiraceae bacterium]|nr:penicillin-binding transpeptidase domain-containing protein [Oscillospiraceae bacterium]